MSGIRIDIREKTFSGHGREVKAIQDLQLHIHDNEFVCLVGPSGCGKTTLLNIVAGLDPHYQGQIRLGKPRQDANIGYVFQNPRLLPWHTLRRNIELVFPGPLPTELIDELLVSMQLEDVQNVHPERLSLGMQRRAAIIRAFAIDPDLLLMDEPFVSLDAPTARVIRNLLHSLWRRRPHTVLFVTHDLREAIALADRLMFLSASPMRLVADIPVNIAWNDRNDALKIEDFRQHLLNNFPEITTLL